MDDKERREVTHHVSRIALWWLVVAAVAAWLLWMTLRSQAQVTADLTVITTPAAAQGVSIPFLIGFLGNIAVFIPLGAAAAFALANKPRWTRLLAATAIGAGLSAAIELLQRTIPSRFSGFDDWLLNTIGTFIGAVIVNILICRRDRRR
ncbi:MAG TPA: VanZ family protein [Anaerolineae bacterium]|nr:VanZ family protein [Anaerolineae bacterium]HQH37686.1 VanZ family protein [Anaerolineae bacterium]